MAQYQRPSDRSAFEIAILCALPSEADPVLALFDEHWEHTQSYGKALGDPNTYTTGRIGRHNVVLSFMPGPGKAHAASVAASFRSSFQNIKLCLLTGICGGVPGGTHGQEEILLGDVIISTGIIQYDFGRQFSHQVIRKNTLHDQIGRPNPEIRSVLNKLMGAMGREQLQKGIMIYLNQLSLQPLDHLSYPGVSEDILFDPNYSHKHHDIASCMACSQNQGPDEVVCDTALSLSCADLRCDPSRLVRRERLERASRRDAAGSSMKATTPYWPQPMVHLGLIASGDLVMKTAHRRDVIAKEEKVIAFEMEGAGVWDQFPTIVMKGVCDYADSHKNKKWQKYAASTAAACAKAFLTEWRTEDPRPRSVHNLEDTMTEPALSRRSTNHVLQFSPVQSSEPNSSSDLNVVPLEDQRRFYLESLSFNRIDAHQFNIKKALERTCTWLLSTSEYLQWLDHSFLPDHHGFLWIKGKPAAGKSTIMKFALQNAEKSMPDNIIISFFFNARGESLEQSTAGMYRSLLLQLLQKAPNLQSLLDNLRSTDADMSSKIYEWDTQTLQNLFERAIERLDGQCLMCFIDALDECPEDQIREMVRFLECLGKAATAATSKCRLLICFSSRHYPHITIENSVMLVLEDQESHKQDIAKYINSELKVGRSKLAEQIKAEVLERALGIFLWVVLVVRILNKEFDRGRLHALQRKLKEIPNDLDKLFMSVLTRDGENIAELILCIRWILHARQPLKCEELYYAILVGMDPNVVDEWEPAEVQLDDMERFILSSSKGLAEVTKGRDRRVQFIHESVRDFLLKENGLDKLQQNLNDNFQGTSHEILRNTCQCYMNASISDLAPDGNELELFSKQFPLLEYAVMNILWHADAAHGLGINQVNFLKSFFSHSLWISRRNFFGRHKKGRAYTSKASLLYIYTCERLLHLMQYEIQQVPCIDIPGEYYGYPLYAALFYKDKQVLETLLKPVPMISCDRSASDEHVLSLTDQTRHVVISKLLGNSGGKKYSKSRTLLSYAAEDGDSDLIRVLLSTGKMDAGIYDKDSRKTPLIWAAARGHHDVVKLLISMADINFVDPQGYTALTAAVSAGSSEVVRELLSSSAIDPNISWQRPPLGEAASQGHKEIVRLLLADKRVHPEQEHFIATYQPLWAAALSRHANAKEIVKMILDTGRVNAELKDEKGCTLFSNVVYSICCSHKHTTMTRLPEHGTIDTGRELTSSEQRDIGGQFAVSPGGRSSPKSAIQLSARPDFTVEGEADEPEQVRDQTSICPPTQFPADTACFNTNKEIADILLHTGRVNPNTPSTHLGYTALHYSVIAGNVAAVDYLLSLDQVDPNLKDHMGQTSLHKAILCQELGIVKQLLAKVGVLPNEKDEMGLSPMLMAACKGSDPAINMLVDTGDVDLDVEYDHDSPSPIEVAAAAGFEQTVRLLSNKPLSRSISNVEGSLALYRRVICHISGRIIRHELESKPGDFDRLDTSDPQDCKIQMLLLGQIHRRRSMFDGMKRHGKFTQASEISSVERYMFIRAKRGQMKQNGLQDNFRPIALIDYQMQLRLLEQQNKKRLSLERQDSLWVASMTTNTPLKQSVESASAALHSRTSTTGSQKRESPRSGAHTPSDQHMQSMLIEQHEKKRRTLASQEESSSKRQVITPLSRSDD